MPRYPAGGGAPDEGLQSGRPHPLPVNAITRMVLLLICPGRGEFRGDALFFQLFHVLFRVFLELRVAARAAEVDAFALVIGIDFFVDVAPPNRAEGLGLGLGGPEAPGGKGRQGQGQEPYLDLFHNFLLIKR